MGLFGVRHAEGVYKLDWRQEQAERIVVEDGVPIPLTALEDWYVMYSLMPKREEKTTMIEQYWQANGMTRPDLLNKALQRELPESLRRKLRLTSGLNRSKKRGGKPYQTVRRRQNRVGSALRRTRWSAGGSPMYNQ